MPSFMEISRKHIVYIFLHLPLAVLSHLKNITCKKKIVTSNAVTWQKTQLRRANVISNSS